MSTPFLSEITLFSFNFAPRGWAFCAGQIVPIQQNQALFALIGTFYGGNGTSNFALPDLRGRVAMTMGEGPGLAAYTIGQQDGEESHTLVSGEMAAHNHPINAAQIAASSGTNAPGGAILASASSSVVGNPPVNVYSSAAPSVTLNANTIGATGGDQAHENRMPFLAINYCIALQGIFPTRT
jgi:microcystin-dependent protein